MLFILSEAKQLASKFICKYIETSATLNHQVDELLVGILKQIKRKLNPEVTDKIAVTSKDVCFKGPKGLLNKLFHLKPKVKAYNDVLAL